MKRSWITPVSQFAGRRKWKVALTITLAVLSSAVTILIPVSIGKYYELLFNLQSTRAGALNWMPESFFSSMKGFMIFFGVLVLLKFALQLSNRYLRQLLGEQLVKEMRENLFLHQLRLDSSVYDEKGTGRYLLRYSGDLKGARDLLTKGMIGLAGDSILLLGVVIVLAWTDFRLALPLVVLLPFLAWPIVVLNRRLYSVSTTRRNRTSGLISFVNLRLRAISTVKAFNREKPEMSKFQHRSDKLYASGKKFQWTSAMLHAAIPALVSLLLMSVLGLAAWIHAQGTTISQGTLLACVLLMVTSLSVLRRIFRANMYWKLGKLSLEKLNVVLELPAEDLEAHPDLALEDGGVKIRNVSFGYEGKMVFKNLNLDFKPCSLTVVTADAGVGKSTLIKLILGMYRPQEGSVEIDDQALETVNRRSVRKKISVVSEDYPLLGKTVFEATSYSRKEDRKPGVQRLLDRVQKDSGIVLNTEGLVGDLGANLSGSERKLLLHVRALLTRKPILLLDAPFDGLDDKQSAALAQRLNKLRGKRTLIVFDRSVPPWIAEPDAVVSLPTPQREREPLRKVS